MSFHRVKDGAVVETWPERPRHFWSESTGAISNLHAAAPRELAGLGLHDGEPETPPAFDDRLERLVSAPRYEPGAVIQGPNGPVQGPGRVVEGWIVIAKTPAERLAERKELAAALRLRLRERLQATQHLAVADAPLTAEERAALATHRSALWDLLTNPPADPRDAVLPPAPVLRAELVD